MGIWIRAVRRSLGKTQSEFAEMIKSGTTSVQKWESGERRSVRTEHLQKILQLASPALRASCPALSQEVDNGGVSDPSAKALVGTNADKGHNDGTDFLAAELESRNGIINDVLYTDLVGIIGNLRGAATSAEGACKTIDAFVAAYAAGLRRRGNR